MRLDVYDEIKSLVDKEELLSDFKMEVGGGSSLGSAAVNFNGKNYDLIANDGSGQGSGSPYTSEGIGFGMLISAMIMYLHETQPSPNISNDIYETMFGYVACFKHLDYFRYKRCGMFWILFIIVLVQFL